MSYYPIFLNMTGKKVLVVGGGLVAQRKVETLLEYSALISLLSRELTPRLNDLVKDKKITFLGSEFTEEHLEGMFLVIAATDDPMLNRQVSRSAQQRGLLINAVDQPEDCNFIVPSIVRRGDLQVAISTSGKSPALARKIRHELEQRFGEEYEKLLFLMGRIRTRVLSQGLEQKENKRVFMDIVSSDILKAIIEKDRRRILDILGNALGNHVDEDTVLEWVLESEAI